MWLKYLFFIYNINYNYLEIYKCLILQSTKTVNGKKKLWRSLKQITAQERSLPWPDNTINCKLIFIVHYYLCYQFLLWFLFIDSSISAPPSFKPSKRYSDISGLIVRILDINYNQS